jgi:hypothetical protein
MSFPMAVDGGNPRSLRNLAVRLHQAILVTGETVEFRLLHNGAPVAGFLITFVGPTIAGAMQTVIAGPELFSVPGAETFDIEATAISVTLVLLEASATLLVE